MLSFELSVIDIVLTIAVVVLLLLFLAQRKTQTTTKAELLIKGQEKISEKPKKPVEDAHIKTTKADSPEELQKCIHHFGYLKNLPKNTPIPDACFGCPRLLRCMFPNE